MDTEVVFKLIEAAKYAIWDTVFEILNEKPYLINVVPVNKSWSTLQQAVYHNNIDVVKKLITIECCDVNIRTKRDRHNEAESGITPIR
jgi:hypothetical protein